MNIAEQLKTIPPKPGVYIFHDARGEILYVGKAKSLRSRVRSYFQPRSVLEPAKQQMVPQVAHIDTVSCDTENEALILEANLIRAHQPPYNIVLTDDKYYLFIKITKEAWPRIYAVRRLVTDGARYFGPFSSASAVRHTLKLLRRLFPHFGESYTDKTWFFPHPLFSPATSTANTPTLTLQVGQAIDAAQYRLNIANVINFLEGKREPVMARLRTGMAQAAAARAYEQAALFRDQLQAIEKLEGSHKVYLPRSESFDVISIATDHNQSAANVFLVRGGKLLHKNTFLLKHRTSALPADVLRQFLLQYYRVAQDIPPSILLPFALPDQAAIARWINAATTPHLVVPHRGKKKQLIRMGELNAQQLLTAEQIYFKNDARLQRATQELATALGLTPPLRRIEIYDISNIQGTSATGAMVVFVDGKPHKSHYKKFRIRFHDTARQLPTDQPNDYAMLQQVINRRFASQHTDWPLPDLIIIDGGKGQLSAVKKSLDQLNLKLPVIALAKREEEIFLPGQRAPRHLPYNSDALYLIQRMRDEAHRFSITYHRLLRSKKQQHSLLDEVPSIGPKTKQRLLTHFGSLKKIRMAPPQEIAQIIGSAKATALQDYL